MGNCESDGAAARQWVQRGFRCVDEQREQAERRLRDEQRSMKRVQEVLIAKWLSERKGLLHDLADSDPCSILIRSEFEAATPVSSCPARKKKPSTPQEKPDSVIDGLKRLFQCFFK